MNRIDLNTKVDYTDAIPIIKDEKQTGKGVFNVIMVIVVGMLIAIFLFLLSRYANKSAIGELEDKINASVNEARNIVKGEEFNDDYLLVKFPGDPNITQDGYIVTDTKKYKEFVNGYIIIYKDDSISFKLSDGTYCASKSFDTSAYKLYIFGQCSDYDIEYKSGVSNEK